MIIIKKNSAFIILRNTCKKLEEHWCSAEHRLRTSGLESRAREVKEKWKREERYVS